jgi:hypothetical protein
MTRHEGVTRPHSVARPLRPRPGGGPGNPLSSSILLATLALAISCSPHQTTRDQWLSIKPQEKRLVVTMLLGHEKVLDRKGGNPRSYTATPDEYVRRIDELYARGDRELVEQIWLTLADSPRRGAIPPPRSGDGGEIHRPLTPLN